MFECQANLPFYIRKLCISPGFAACRGKARHLLGNHTLLNPVASIMAGPYPGGRWTGSCLEPTLHAFRSNQ